MCVCVIASIQEVCMCCSNSWIIQAHTSPTHNAFMCKLLDTPHTQYAQAGEQHKAVVS